MAMVSLLVIVPTRTSATEGQTGYAVGQDIFRAQRCLERILQVLLKLHTAKLYVMGMRDLSATTGPGQGSSQRVAKTPAVRMQYKLRERRRQLWKDSSLEWRRIFHDCPSS